MTFTKHDVEKVADLSKLELNEAEKERVTKQLDEILKYGAKINELDFTDVPASPSVCDLQNIMRENEVQSRLTQEEALMNAPARHGGFFSVPKVIRRAKK